MKKPTNTTKEVHSNPILGFAACLEGGIEAQEARGQRELINSDVLPTDLGREKDSRAKYEALGFVFGATVVDDPIFQNATLPKGWKRQGSNHSMWSHIIDERGLKRVAIFYKAAFYDRSAHMSLCNVGRELASEFIWGDAVDPMIPAGLTAEEIKQAKLACAEERRDRKPRAEKFLSSLP